MFHLANALSATRIALVPVLLGLAWNGSPVAFLVTLAVSLATDVLDGLAARGLGQSSELGARLDSWGDLLTYAAAIPCVVWLWPDVVAAQWRWFALALASFVVPTAYGWISFGRLTSYHTWGAKASALLIGPSVFALLLVGPTAPFQVAVLVLAASAIEEMLITRRLPAWRADVPSYLYLLRSERRVGSAAPAE